MVQLFGVCDDKVVIVVRALAAVLVVTVLTIVTVVTKQVTKLATKQHIKFKLVKKITPHIGLKASRGGF